jgi:DHA1 family bicyclomycin/chloramphenicol resistance-like MFS transporter
MLLLAAFGGITPLSIDMYLSSWPAMAVAFHGTIGDMQLSLSSFFVGFAAGQLVFGPLSDSVGRRPMVLLGIGLYLVATALCLITSDTHLFILLRLMQGLGSCVPPIMSRAIVRDRFERDGASRMLSLLLVISLIVPLLAPLLGGYLLVLFGWRSLFWVMAGLGVVLAAATLRWLPETLSSRHRRTFSLMALVAGYGHLLRHQRYLGFTLTSAFMMSGLFAYISSASYLLVTVAQVPPQLFGYYIGVNVIGQIVMAYVNSHWVGRMGSERMLAIGLALGLTAAFSMIPAAYFGSGWLHSIAVPLAVYVSIMGLISGNSLACSLVAFPSLAGTGTALAGCLLFVMGSGMAALMTVLRDGTTLPLAVVIALSTLAAAISYLSLVRPWQNATLGEDLAGHPSIAAHGSDHGGNIVAE